MGSCHAGHAARARRVATPSKKWERARKNDNLDQTAHVLAVRKDTMRRGNKGARSKERERYNCGNKDTRRARTNETVHLGTPPVGTLGTPTHWACTTAQRESATEVPTTVRQP